ncbi:hypothetical protein TIFTF001_033831 [Ficus carica]|uniref:Uncharacterized protein n=1 Tax=Ficus carica TaxID=3494 RepID=A0AA88J9V4_FICCA|nr:hypothetical protein TIFTF001_033831 [Ficus carica]
MEPAESSSPQPLPEGEGKEEVKEADELKLGVAKDTATETSDVESPMAAQRRLTEGEGELEVEEHQEGDRMTTESLFEQEGDRENKYYGTRIVLRSLILRSLSTFNFGLLKDKAFSC